MATNDTNKNKSSNGSKQQPVRKKSSGSQATAKKKPTSSSKAPAKKSTSKAPAKKSTSKASAKKSSSSKATAKKTNGSKVSAKKSNSSKATAKKTSGSKATAKKSSSSKVSAKKKPTSQSTKKSSKSKQTTKKVAKVSAAGLAAKKATSKAKDTEKKKVQAVKRPQSAKRKPAARKLNNLEVRNSHASQNRKRKKIKFVKPQRRVNEPHIYDEAKYLKTLKKSGKKNLMALTTMFGVLFMLSLIFVIKLEVTHTKNGNNLADYAQNNYTETTSVESTRGTIFDTNGEALAINLEVYDLAAITSKTFECNIDNTFQNCALQADQTDEVSKAMAEALNLDADGQAYIKSRLDYGISNGKYEVSFGSQGKNITLSQKKALEKLNYPWLRFDPQELRFYPYGDFASYIIGYTTKDEDGELNGALGVEKALDGHLKGQDGVQTSLFDNYGIELTEAQQSAIPKIDGTDVYLTLDSVIQTYLENSMEKALSADGVSDIEYEGLFTIVMDAKNGDILAAQSYPSFDPNVREIENYTNYFTNYCFEPGSTFKAATVAAADEAGVWDDNATESTGSRTSATWGGATVGDWNDSKGWGSITWAQGFYLSSNTVMTYIMDQIPKDFWIEFVTEKLLIGTPVETQFFETPSCIFNPKYDLEYATTSFGQGMTVNVLQLLRMYSALVGDGNMVTPHIVQTIKDSDTGEEIYSDESLEIIENVVSPETSEHVRDLLRGVVTYEGPNEWQTSDDGTGFKYKGSDYDIGMKTGTAQMVGDNGQYEKDKFIYSGMAAAPIDDPQLLVYTAVIAPEKDKTNISYLAFPQYTKEVIDNSLSYLNSENRAVDIDEEVPTYRVGAYVGTQMDDVDSPKATKIGSGKITSQYPKAGQVVSSNQKVMLFGTDDLSFPDLTGYSYNEAVATCNALEVTCDFANSGTKVLAVTNEGEKKYKIKME